MNQTGSQFGTNVSLLGRLRADPFDQQSWTDFVGRYGAMILKWCYRWGLKTQDAEEVTQIVLVQLARQMAQFEYDPGRSFRGWLKTIAHRTWCDFLENQSRRRQCGLSPEVIAQLQTPDVAKSFLDEIEQEARREEMQAAMNAVRLKVAPHTWRAFELTAIENIPPGEVAETLNMKVPTVYVAKSKVIRMIRKKLERD